MSANGNAAWKESISLEETNKIRISLGLKPIIDDTATTTGAAAEPDADTIANNNYVERRQQEAKDRDTLALQSRIDRSLNARERARKLVGVGLGHIEDDGVKLEQGMDEGEETRAWIKKQKKNAKLLAQKREKQQAEADADALAQASNAQLLYGEADLTGIKVAHGQEDFEQGEDIVLTLKDSRVLDDEDDELHNLNISENAVTASALELKRKGAAAGAYTGYDDDEFIMDVDDPDGDKRGDGKKVLKKYDEEIDGKKEIGFRLGASSNGAHHRSVGNGKGSSLVMEKEKEKVVLSMDYTKSFAESDYLQVGEADVAFKKAKTKKKKRAPSRLLTTDDDVDNLPSSSSPSLPNPQTINDPSSLSIPITDGSAASSAAPTPSARREPDNIDSINLIDDDELQAALARSRRIAAKAARRNLPPLSSASSTFPSSVDAVVKQEDGEEMMTVKQEDEQEEEVSAGIGFVMDDMTEFVQRIGRHEPLAPPPSAAAAAVHSPRPVVPARPPSASSSTHIKQETMDVDIPISEMTTSTGANNAGGGGGGGAGGWGAAREDGEESDDDPAAMTAMNDSDDEEDDGKAKRRSVYDPDALSGTAAESFVSSGMASTLTLLRQQGLMKVRSADELLADRERKEKSSWLANKALREREREQEALRKRTDGRSQSEREADNRARDAREARETMEAFNSYKPVVDIKYHDEHGRSLNTKEAWKHLSHAFHGKGSGRLNTEKHLKKIAEEKKREAMEAGDSALVMATAFAMRAERIGSATMVLSTGNKGAAPIALDPLAAPKSRSSLALSKSKPKSTKEGSSTSSSTVFSDIPMRALPLPTSVAAADGSRRAVSGSPAPGRSGFAPIPSSSTSALPASSSSAVAADAFIIPVSVKRKAAGDANGSDAASRKR